MKLLTSIFGSFLNTIQTRTFPISGKFTLESRNIYDIVHKMIVDTTNGLKAGVIYDDLHVQAHKIVIDGLLELGIFKGDKDDIFAARTSTAFFPHGLGHHLGMDCHDTGGNPNRDDEDKLFPNLRLRGPVPANSVLTIEPGVGFIASTYNHSGPTNICRSTFASLLSNHFFPTQFTANLLTAPCSISTDPLAVFGKHSYVLGRVKSVLTGVRQTAWRTISWLLKLVLKT